MFLERLWTALPFIQWEDTISFHVKLFRCFLLSLLDAHSELAFVSQGSERILAVFGQRLADVGLHDHVSHRTSPLGRHNDAIMRCPPKRRYEVTSLPSFVTTPIDQLIAVPPTFIPHPINITHGLYEELAHFTVASNLPGSSRVLLGRYDAPFTGVVGCVLLWLLTLAIVVWRSSSTERARSTSTRTMCRLPTMAVDTTTDSCKRATRPLHLSMEDGTQSLLAGIAEDVDHQASMPGAWLHERRKQNTFETLPEPVFDMMSWRLICSCAQKAWARFPGATLTLTASGPLDHDSNDTVERTFEDGGSLVCRGSGSKEVDLDAGILSPAVLNGTGVDCSPSESSPSIRNRRGSTTVMYNRREPSTTGDMAIEDLDSAQTTILDAVREDKIGLTFALVASSNADRQDDMPSDGDESASGDRTDGTGDEDLFGVGTQRPYTPLEREDEYRALGRRQDGALSDTGCPLLLRRARSTGCLGKKRDTFDDGDEVAGDDSYWTEQVNVRLSGARPCQHGWSDVSSWPREGREDETDNWRTRNPQVTQLEKASDVQTNSNSNSTKLRRYSSPPLNMNASLSDRAGSDDGPPGIYVVPQKRGRMTGGHSWSPVSSPRASDRPSGLGFFPFRKTPSLLTPEAWRPGCLYIPDPPVDESSQADAWWDSLSSVGSCGSGHMFDGDTVNQDVPEQGPPSSRDPQGGQVSWRDRYENDPASRRFNAVHRRATTEG